MTGIDRSDTQVAAAREAVAKDAALAARSKFVVCSTAPSFAGSSSTCSSRDEPAMLDEGRVTGALVDGMKRDLQRIGGDDHGVFFYTFVQARARA